MTRPWWRNTRGALGLLLVCGLLLEAVACRDPQGPLTAAGLADGQPVIICNGTVIDGTGAKPIPSGCVIIEGERITGVGREAQLALPHKARIIDARGGTILPGLIDSHVHSAWSGQLRREFLELGVTSICDLGSPLARMDDFRRDAWQGKAVARGFRAGPILTAPGGLPDAVLHAGLNYEVGTPEEAQGAVTDLVGREAQVIKVYLQPTANSRPYPMLSEAALKGLVDAAHAQGVLVRAHVTKLSLVPGALDCGVDVIEHVPEPELTEEGIMRDLKDSDDPLADLFELYVVAEYDTLLPQMAKQEVVMVPTLARLVIQRYGFPDLEPGQRILVDGLLEIVRRFHAAGGVIALGTDHSPGVEGIRPDLILSEIQLLHNAGLTPLEVIESATRHAAAVCGQGHDLGTLEAGKLADILIVDGNPVADLGALENVMLVIKGGEVAHVAAVEGR